MLVNCAGTSIAGKFEEVEVDRFKVGTRTANSNPARATMCISAVKVWPASECFFFVFT